MGSNPVSSRAITTSRLPVSVLVITLNEERWIARCLSSVVWADEIVVVDAESRDRTPKICQQPRAPWASQIRFVSRAWTGFKDQRNFALAQAKNDWVFVIDADEVCSPELQERLESLLSAPGGPDMKAYKVHRQEYFLGRPIFYGMWNPSYQDRFFDKRGVQYVNDVHEYPVFNAVPGRIHEPLLHLNDLSIEGYLDKMNRYTTLEAQDRYSQGQRTTVFKLLGAFPAHTFKTYFYYKAYKDGVHGLVISILEGISRAARQIKIWQLAEREKTRQSESEAKSSISFLN